jgi:hypothetical protein
MDTIMRLWPRPTSPMRLWRVYVLTPEQAKSLPQGLDVPFHRYSSWTSAPETIPRLVAARNHMGVPVVIQMDFKPENICIDVQDFVQKIEEVPVIKTTSGWAQYWETSAIEAYADEAEVIVHLPDDKLRLTAENTTIAAPTKSPPPQIGDSVFEPHTHSDDGYEIEEVIEQTTFGTWIVKLEYREEEEVHYIAPGEWEIVQRYGR